MEHKFKIENGNIPTPSDYPLRAPGLIDRLDAINAELRAIKDVVYREPRYAKARLPMANTLRNLILVEGYLLNADAPLAVVDTPCSVCSGTGQVGSDICLYCEGKGIA